MHIYRKVILMGNIFWIIAVAVIAAGIGLLTVGVIDGNRFVVVKEEFELPNIAKECRFVLISDLHNKVYGKKNDKLINAIENINPDFILIAGDLVTSREKEDMTPAIELVNTLSKHYHIYYGMGNHETKIKSRREDFGDIFDALKKSIDSTNVTMLENECVILPDYNIALTGLELDLEYFAHFRKKPMAEDYLNTIIGKPRRGRCNVLIAHNPDYFEEYSDWGADLVLSGHIHGGIMRLPVLGGVIAPSYRLFPKYDGGIFKEKNSTMLLSRGIGSHTIPLRFFNPAELHAVTIKPAET